ncbi:metallophosphoesterase family protein [Parapedobacter sp. 10938]|uniref:metallophosphoesterase family protein n=1 Tax=Parapedobacter flavus TaxID=3110225 RepID=UPI002DBD6A9B|nr:metallophosphoesterase family protein [Parapedobacter sp. 10938]MEC3880602.1 metallophosphoesterase family protein [Parapedobacter sp. 10938]
MRAKSKQRIVSLLFLVAACNWLPAAGQELTDSLPRRIILNVTEDLASSIAINWQTSGQVKASFAELAVADADPRFVARAIRKKAATERVNLGDAVSPNYHSLIFDDLIPNTKYAYRVGGGNHWSEWFHFVTASDKPTDPFQFIYFGDVQVNIRSLWSRVVREAFAKAPNARLQLYAGDLINRANRDEEWADWFAAGGFIHSMIPGLPSPGNHDHVDLPNGERAASVFWRPQFNLPLNGPEGLEETCYFVDVQGVRFISLNSDQAEESDHYLETQRIWLERILEHNPNTWTVLTFHHPIYSPKGTRDNKRMRETFKPLFDRYGVDLVLQGHDHTYARGMDKIPMDDNGKTSGTMYVVSVSGPKMTGSHVEKKSWMDRSAIYTQLFQIIDVSPQKLSFKAYLATGELYDAFDLIKQEGAKNKLIDKVPAGMPERQ